ncbi:MAG: 16S rRNA (uracil(1498)-N(3))-methyltransferase, partial [Methylocella sp.]
MSRYDFAARRLYVNPPLAQAAQIALDQAQAHYVRNVLRLSEGARILVFNGRDGEWETRVAASNRKYLTLAVEKLIRPQEPRPDLHYLFAPLKQARQDYMVEKAVEMGAGLLRPVLTGRTQASRINSERMHAHAIEAAEQCGILSIPEIAPAIKLDALLGAWEKDRLLIFCDEDAPSSDPLAALRPRADAKGPPALAVLVGPEGGFAAKERAALLGLPRVIRLPLGPRVLRADTAAVAAL